MHNSQLLDITEQKVFVIRDIHVNPFTGYKSILSPYQGFPWSVGIKQSTDTFREQLEIYLNQEDNPCLKLYSGGFHSFSSLDDAIDQLLEDFKINYNSYVIYEATATGIICEGVNDDDRECYFSTELTLNKIVYDARQQE